MTNESTELRMIIVANVVKGINKLVYDTVTVTLAEPPEHEIQNMCRDKSLWS